MGISRPIWALFLPYCYFLIPFTLLNSKNLYPILFGFITMFFFFLGHFSLNALFDRDADRANRRKNASNSWDESLNFKGEWIWILILVYWIISILGAFIHQIIFRSSFIIIMILIAIILAIAYSTPPIRVKGRAPMDLLINQFSFGIIGPLFAIESFGILHTFPLAGLIILLIFSVSTLTIVVLPTIMMDTTIDKQYGYNTFSVKFGLRNAVKVTLLSLGIQLVCIVVFSAIAIYEENFLFILMMVALVTGESCFIFLLWRKPTEKNAEFVASLFASSFLSGGIHLLVITHLLPFTLSFL
ncbi:MAG: UbiA family prenyltransferase [Candidatus Hodarchaeota archaeon]